MTTQILSIIFVFDHSWQRSPHVGPAFGIQIHTHRDANDMTFAVLLQAKNLEERYRDTLSVCIRSRLGHDCNTFWVCAGHFPGQVLKDQTWSRVSCDEALWGEGH